MEILWAVLLGAVQGLAEFFPVSSSGVLFLLEQGAGFSSDSLPLINLFLHAGTMLAVLVVLSNDVGRSFAGFRSAGRDALRNARIFITGSSEKYLHPAHTTYQRLSVMIFFAALAAGLTGILLSPVAVRISGSVLYTGVGFILNGTLLLVLSRIRIETVRLKDIPLRRAFLIGIAGGASVIPGISWTGMVEGAAVLSGYSMKAAIRFSYLLSVPAVVGGLAFELASAVGGGNITGSLLAAALPGMGVSFFIGMLMLRRAQQFLRRRGFLPFALLSLVAGAAVVWVSFM